VSQPFKFHADDDGSTFTHAELMRARRRERTCSMCDTAPVYEDARNQDPYCCDHAAQIADRTPVRPIGTVAG
jgi:hypothetical protein